MKTDKKERVNKRLAACLDAFHRRSQARIDLTYGPSKPNYWKAIIMAACILAIGLIMWSFWGPNHSNNFHVEAYLRKYVDGIEDPSLEVLDEISLNDKLYMTLNSKEPVYVYVFNADSENVVDILFPKQGNNASTSTPKNPLPSKKKHRLPNESNSWEVGTEANWEIYYIFASRFPISDAEAQRKMIVDANLTTMASEDRGTGKIVPIKTDSDRELPGPEPETISSQLESLYNKLSQSEDVWARRIVAKHVAKPDIDEQ